MKGTKEQSKLTLFPVPDFNAYDSAKNDHISFDEYLNEYGYLIPSKQETLIDPYFRFKLFSSAKFNEKKYAEDKSKILDYYNSLGYQRRGNCCRYYL